jgi:hypothetical protein
MILIGGVSIALVVITTVIHYEVLRLLSTVLPLLRTAGRAKLIIVILGAFAAHASEVALYAGAYYFLSRYFNAGTLGDSSPINFTRCLYFSGETFSSLGYGDVVPHENLRLLAGVEALNGLLLIGWSASYAYIAMERFWDNDDLQH